ncbi:hypothetical protein BH18ACT2_BH18ACT2_20040 [soil metagenome]
MQLGTVTLADMSCERPTGLDDDGVVTPGPGGGSTTVPGSDDLADTGTGTALVIALVAAMFITGGASTLLCVRRGAKR